jgi:hypothetical protein
VYATSANKPNTTFVSRSIRKKIGVKVKVCGMKYQKTFWNLLLQPDYLGLFFGINLVVF